MTDTAPPVATDEPSPLPHLALVAAAAKVMGEEINTRTQAARDDLLEQLLVEYRRTKGKAFEVHVPGAEQAVGTVTLRESKDGIVVRDQAEFVAWVEDKYPDEVEWKPTVRPSFQKLVLEKLAHIVTEDDGSKTIVLPDEKTGDTTPIPGLAYKPAGDPTSFGVTFKTDKRRGFDGRAIVRDLLDQAGMHRAIAFADNADLAPASESTVPGEVVSSEQVSA